MFDLPTARSVHTHTLHHKEKKRLGRSPGTDGEPVLQTRKKEVLDQTFPEAVSSSLPSFPLRRRRKQTNGETTAGEERNPQVKESEHQAKDQKTCVDRAVQTYAWTRAVVYAWIGMDAGHILYLFVAREDLLCGRELSNEASVPSMGVRGDRQSGGANSKGPSGTKRRRRSPRKVSAPMAFP